jgi:hypothetical protein
LSAWLVRLSVAVTDSDGSAVELESSESITSPLQPAIVQELKERLFGYSSKGCNIIELGAPSYPPFFPKAFWDPHAHKQQLTTDVGAGRILLGAGTGIVSLVLAGLRSAHSAPAASYAESCILSTDLCELSTFNFFLQT